MTVFVSSLGGAGWQFLDSNGNPLTGGKLYTYLAGTTTPATTYTSRAGNTANANPIVLDAAGRTPAEVWLTQNVTYKFVLKTSDDVLIGTYDNIPGINDVQDQSAAIYAAFAASSGSSLVGFIQAGTGAVARTVQTKARDWVDVRDFSGVDPTGIADSTSGIINALATGKAVNFGGSENTYLISGSLNLSAYQEIFGQNATIKTASNIPMVVMSRFCAVTGLRFEGNAAGNAQRGIFIDGGAGFDAVSRTRVSDCGFFNLGQSGYYVTRIVNAHEGNILTGCTFYGCGYGVEIGERGEYTTITGCNIDTCTQGIRIIGGNTCVAGSVISNCTIGLLIGRGSNDAHGTVTGCLVNHSTQYAVKFDNPSVNDFRIADCEFYYGDIWFYRSTGMSFANCTFGSNNNFYFQGSIDTYFESCRFVTLPTFNNSYNGEPSKTHWVDTQYANLTGGQTAPNINGGYVEVRLASTTSIASGVQVVPFDMLSYNAVTNDLAYTYESFWDAGTYTFQNLTALKSPNSNSDCDAIMQLTFGGAGVIDFTKISVYLYEVGTARVVANFTPSVKTYTDGTNNWKVYTLAGRVPKSTYRVVVENDTGNFITAYREQGTNIPFKAVITGF